jgi:hypothetical protein
MAGTRTQGSKDASSLWVWEPLLSCSLPTKVRLLMVQNSIWPAVMYGAVWGGEKAGQDKTSAGRKKSSQHLAASDCSSDGPVRNH